MPKIELLHNDDEVLNPLDTTLRIRGSLRIDGHERGSWEEHLDGHYVARIGDTELSAANRRDMIERIAQQLAG